MAGHNLGLNHAIRLWPTPNASEHIAENYTLETTKRHLEEGRQVHLAQMVKLWPTPSSGMHKQDVANDGHYAQTVLDGGFQMSLPAAVKLFPTPNTQDAKGAGGMRSRANGRQAQLHNTVKLFPTPAARDWKDTGTAPAEGNGHSPPLAHCVGGQLNPDWVELLMGWPQGWTALAPLDPAVFAAWLDAFRSGQGQRAWQDGLWEAGVPRVAVKPPHRVPRLTAIGNGQVPAALVRAVQVLALPRVGP